MKEKVYNVLDGESLMEIGDEKRVVRKNDIVFITPGTWHSIENTGLGDLTFIVVTTPVRDE